MRRRALACLLLLGACGHGPDASPFPGDAGAPTVDTAAAAAADQHASWISSDGSAEGESQPASPSCAGLPPLAAHDYTLTIPAAGSQPARTALVHVPPGYDGSTRLPLVFNNHGNACTALMQVGMSHLNEAVDKRSPGAIVVYPQGTGGLLAGWSSGKSPLSYLYASVDDVGFFKQLIEALSKQLCVDPKRIYCAGFSLGGSMCYRLACDLSEQLAAIASVAGPDGTESCSPKRAVPLLHLHGTADSWASYSGETTPDAANKGAPTYVAAYAARAGCSATPQTTLTQGAVTCQTWSGCRDGAEATLCTVKDGGHTWPGGDGWLLGGAVNRDINATEMILDFFARHPLP